MSFGVVVVLGVLFLQRASFEVGALRVAPTVQSPVGQRRPEPARIEKTANYREAVALSERIAALGENRPSSSKDAVLPQKKKKKVAIIGGGLSGLACAKYLSDAGHEATIYEARDVLGGKTSAWRDADGDVVETGLHVFFGAYPNMLRLMSELDIRDRLQWKAHRMSFAMRDAPGAFTSFEFPDNVPAPFNMAAAILKNTDMLTFWEKLQMVPGLLPMLVRGQDFIDEQDAKSVLKFMREFRVPSRALDEVFDPMGKALDFIDASGLSMAVILTAMNRFINEADGSQTAFLDGNQPDRLCRPIVDHVERRGGAVRVGAPVVEIATTTTTTDDDVQQLGLPAVSHLVLKNGEKIVADEYVSAVPVDVLKRVVPRAWSTAPFFRQLDELEGVPVINVQLWLDKKLDASLDGLAFSRSPLLSVYADMSRSCREYEDPDRSMLSLVFAPVVGGGARGGSEEKKKNWLAESDDAVVDATVAELERLFPGAIARADVRKAAVVRVPRSVYAAVPGRNRYRPSQKTPVPNFTLAGDYTSQRYLGSMEGAVLAGKLAALAVAARDRPESADIAVKPVVDHIREQRFDPRDPRPQWGGADNTGAIAFGGGEDRVRP